MKKSLAIIAVIVGATLLATYPLTVRTKVNPIIEKEEPPLRTTALPADAALGVQRFIATIAQP